MSVKLREKKIKNGKSYYLDIYHEGERSYEFLDIKVLKSDSSLKRKEQKAIAEAIRDQKSIELSAEGTVYTPRHIKNADLIAYCENYLNNYPKKDVRMIKYSIEKFKDFLKAERLLSRSGTFRVRLLTPNVAKKFKDYLVSDESGLTGETPLNYLSRFKKVIRHGKSQGLFKKDPFENITFSKKETQRGTLKKNVLTVDELRDLASIECANAEVKRAFLFACYTGLGIAEIKVLKWSNIQNERLMTKRQKTNAEVNIKLSAGAIKLLGDKKTSNELVFDISISDTAINKNLRSWVKKAKIDKHITFYCGRHTYAVLLLNNNTNLKTVADALAHKSTQHTIKYLNYVNSLKDKATGNLPEIM